MSITRNSDLWPTLQFYFKYNGPDSAHIRSYNDFIAKIPKLLTKEIVLGDFMLKMHSPKFIPPTYRIDGETESYQQFPSNCLNIKSTYEVELTCTFSFYYNKKLVKEEEGITIAAIPLMVGSDLCNLHPKNLKIPKDIDASEKKQKESTKRWKKMMEMEFQIPLGGYFVKDGTSRCITFQERSKFNIPMVFDKFDNTSKSNKYTYYVECRNSVSDDHPTGILSANLNKSGDVYIICKYLDDKKEIPAILFFYAMGFIDPQEIVSFIIHQDDPLLKLDCVKLAIQRMFELADGVNWLDELSTLGMNSVDNKEEYVSQLIKNKFLHHYANNTSKAIYFGYILYCLLSISVPGEIKAQHPEIDFVKADDRDHFGSKVLNTESMLFSNVFYLAVRKQIDSMEKFVALALKDKTGDMAEVVIKEMNAKMIFPESDITKMPITTMLSKALTSNLWGNSKRDGVSTVYDPINYNNAVILLMRSCIPLKSFINNIDPRMVHGSYFGFIDLFDTPEGETIGYNKVLSSSCYVSSEIDISNLRKYIAKNIVPLSKSSGMLDKNKVFIDNHWMGVATTEKCLEIYNNIRYQKRNGTIDPSVSIVWKCVPDKKGKSDKGQETKSPKGSEKLSKSPKGELHLYSQEGRLLRPYLIVENGTILLKTNDWKHFKTWNDFLGSGKVELLDPNEYEYIKKHCVQIDEFLKLPKEVRKTYSHVDIHPATMFGPGAGSITCPNMMQGPRNSYGANQSRQAVGTTTRFDAPRNLFYPQRPLVRNKIASMMLHYDEYPAGMNVLVALMPALGFEQEDGYIINRSYIEMGGFMTNKIIRHVVLIDGTDEKLEIPKVEECFRLKPKDLSNIDKEGIIKKGSIVYMNDPLVCKTVAETNGQFKKTDCTLFHTDESVCWVQDVIVKDKGFRNSKMVKIVLRETRIGKYGNKFAPRSAQKGTCTYVCPPEDMPFDPITKQTVTVCVNPLSLHSRMTIGYLHEIFLGEYVLSPDRIALENGEKGVYNHPGFENCTPFDEDPVQQYERVFKELRRMGLRDDGSKQLIDGRTGEMINVPIFCGHVHIQALKHMVDDKIAKRATGPIASLMRCPTEGRAKSGGVKTGTMEKDVLAAGDAPEILLDRMCLSSDKFDTTVCKHCGMIESHNKTVNERCKACRVDNAMVHVTMSYSPKVVFQELMGMGVCPRLLLEPKKAIN